jgi:hypothetical protein
VRMYVINTACEPRDALHVPVKHEGFVTSWGSCGLSQYSLAKGSNLMTWLSFMCVIT